MSQATPPEGIAPDVQPSDRSAPADAVAVQLPAEKGLEAATAPASQPPPVETPGDGAGLTALAGEPRQADAEADVAEEAGNGGGEAAELEDDEPQTVLVDDTFAPSDANASPADVQAEPEVQSEKDGDAAASAEPSRPPRPTAVVRYGAMRSIGEFKHNSETPIPRGTKLVIRSERGVELGEVVAPVCAECDRLHLTSDHLRQFIRDNGPDYPFRRDGRVLRVANPQDVIDYRHLEQSAREAAAYCRQIIRDLNLDMRLVAVEHLLGGERLVFFFAAEHRVDFRELVRMLASQYRTRIEMRQVGARDEARLVADYERCGQQCCCQSFLKDLRPVSMRMAKTQKATLDPSKISGRCGRLMCCLRYEDATYELLRKKLPRKNNYVRTADGVVGRVVDAQIITQLVKIQLADFTFQAVANEDIVERDLAAPPASEAPAPPPSRRPDRPMLRKRERLGAAVEAEAEARREQAIGNFAEEDLAAVGADAGDDAPGDATDDDMDIQGADLREAAALDEADQARQPVGAAATGGNQPAPAGPATGRKRRRRKRRKGRQDPAAQAAGAHQPANDTRGGGDESGDSYGGGDEDVGGGGDGPGESTAGSAGQAGQPGAGAGGHRGDRKSRRRRRRGPKGPANRNRPAGAPRPPA